MNDYAYGELGIPTFTFEGRGIFFTAPDSDIVPAGVEQLEGVLALANEIIKTLE